jgi:hypothetical protein
VLLGAWIAVGAIHAAAFAWEGTRAAVDAWRRERDGAARRLGPRTGTLILQAELPWVMPQLLEGVPQDAPLLVVTDSLLPFPLEVHTAPRPTRVLCVWPDRRPARPLSQVEQFLADLRRDQLERQPRRFTRERYVEALAHSTHLLLLNAAPRDYSTPEFELVHVRSIGTGATPAAQLYVVEPRTVRR